MSIEEYRKNHGGKGRGSGKKGKSDSMEGSLQSEILKLLTTHSIYHWRNNTGAGFFSNEKGGPQRFVRFGKVGSGDIFVLHKGVFYSLELKSPTGKPSLDQDLFIQDINENGGKGLIIRSLDQIIKLFNLPYND